jgi:ribose transport system ATP-binding protein
VNALTRPEGLTYDCENTVLSVKNLCRGDKFQNISFDLHRGEVLGIAGMLGAGRTELLRSIFGVDPFDSGTIELNGETIGKINPVIMKEKGMGLTPEDRKLEGLIQIMSINDNLCVASLKKLSGRSFMNRAAERKAVNNQVEHLQIKAGNLKNAVSELSGGNQQKVVIGNWLNNEPKVMLFDEPSRGIDVNAKQQIFKIIWELSSQGIPSIVVSSELEELLEICHRIIIMRYGRFEGEVLPEDTSVEELYSICMGGNDE